MFTALARIYLPTPNISDSRCSYIPQPRWQCVVHVIVSSTYGLGRTRNTKYGAENVVLAALNIHSKWTEKKEQFDRISTE
jgi:hypothetical protein